MNSFTPTDRTKLKRRPNRGDYDRESVYKILDEAFLCHVGFAIDGKPFVIPTLYGRDGDDLYLHGSAASRMLREVQKGADVCIAVTIVDGLVLARSAFHHSINYRSVVIFGTAAIVDEPVQKLKALFTISEHVVPGRWNDIREPSDAEMKQTVVLSLKLEEVSGKIRTGPPLDEEADYAMPVWAGVLPLSIVAGAPERDPLMTHDATVPLYIAKYSRS